MTNTEYYYIALIIQNLCTYLQHYSYLIIFNIHNVGYTSYNYKKPHKYFNHFFFTLIFFNYKFKLEIVFKYCFICFGTYLPIW